MTSQRAARNGYTEVPSDFPPASDGVPSNRCLDWNVCEELALHLASECANVLAEADRSARPVDILLKSYRLIEALGWGEPPLLRWIVRRIAALLQWPVPDIARQLQN